MIFSHIWYYSALRAVHEDVRQLAIVFFFNLELEEIITIIIIRDILTLDTPAFWRGWPANDRANHVLTFIPH